MKKYIRLLFRILLTVALIIFLINLFPTADAIAVNPFNKNGEPIVVSQSSELSSLPSCTMLAYNSAASYGISTFEANVIMTKDEVLIIADKDDLSAYTNAEGNISDKTYEEISSYNFAYNYTNDGESYPYRSQMHTCVKLEDLIAAYPYADYIIGLIQSGESGKRAAVLVSELIRKNDLSMRTVVKADEKITKQLREDQNIHVLTEPSKSELNAYLIMSKFMLGKLYFNIKFQYCEISVEDIDAYSQRALKELGQRNVSIYIKDVKNENDLKKALSYGPNGIMTTQPALIVEVVETTKPADSE